MSIQIGVWNLNGEPVERKLFEHFDQLLKEQGQDGEVYYLDGCFGMLYRPFHTSPDSRKERQPYSLKTGQVITWDGRLDNRDELVVELQRAPAASETDIDVVGAAFAKWGEGCFSKFVGDWAISIWEPNTRQVLLARDYAGIRQLYYCATKQRITWCTCLAPIVSSSEVALSLNEEYLAGYLARFPEAHLTPYREILAVPPAHFVRIRTNEVSSHRYWWLNPKERLRYKTDGEYEEHFRYIFRRAVKRRLRSDSVVLAELSGGLDSSSIVCMADEILAQGEADAPGLHTLSFYDPDEPGGDERAYFGSVEAKRGKIGHHIDRRKYTDSGHLDNQPFSAVPAWLLGKHHLEKDLYLLRQEHGYRTVLSGVGGDELLGGVPNPCPQLADLILQLRFRDLWNQLMRCLLSAASPKHTKLPYHLRTIRSSVHRLEHASFAQAPHHVSPSARLAISHGDEDGA